MICHDCGADDKPLPDADLPVAQIVLICLEYRCSKCLRTPDQVQADFDAETARNPHKSAHDWGTVLKVPILRRMNGKFTTTRK